jgi:purine-binding chemotaxis protein CheW
VEERFELPVEADADLGPTQRLILFRVGAEHLALPIAAVTEVRPLAPITRVPGAPPEVLGIVNLRGRVLTCCDLRLVIGQPQAALAPRARVLVLDLHEADLDVGLLVESIEQVVQIPRATLTDLRVPAAREGAAGYLQGVLNLDGIAVGLLDLARVLAPLLPPGEELGQPALPAGTPA